jgi:hypothetical protein
VGDNGSEIDRERRERWIKRSWDASSIFWGQIAALSSQLSHHFKLFDVL